MYFDLGLLDEKYREEIPEAAPEQNWCNKEGCSEEAGDEDAENWESVKESVKMWVLERVKVLTSGTMKVQKD